MSLYSCFGGGSRQTIACKPPAPMEYHPTAGLTKQKECDLWQGNFEE